MMGGKLDCVALWMAGMKIFLLKHWDMCFAAASIVAAAASAASAATAALAAAYEEETGMSNISIMEQT